MRSRCTGGKGGRPKYGSSTLIPETTTVRPTWQHKTGEEGGGERTWPKASVCKRKGEIGEAVKDETTTCVEDKIGRERSEQTMNRPSWRAQTKSDAEKSPPH